MRKLREEAVMDQERYRQIKKKVLILKNRKPYQAETAQYITEMNQIDWITSCLRLSGTPISQEGVQRIIQGELLVDVSLKNHQLIHRYLETLRHMQSMLEMGTDLTETGLLHLYEILYDPRGEAEHKGVEPVFYRQDARTVETWGYRPPGADEISEQMDIVFKWLALEEGRVNPDLNPIMRSVMLHNKLLEIYPFGECSPAIARLAMLYQLMSAGLPPIRLAMSEQEYNCAIVLYLKKEDHLPLYEAVEKGVYNQLDLMVQLTAIR